LDCTIPAAYHLQSKVHQVTALSKEISMGVNLVNGNAVPVVLGKSCNAITKTRTIGNGRINDGNNRLLKVIVRENGIIEGLKVAHGV
jgi:hypothetical protein